MLKKIISILVILAGAFVIYMGTSVSSAFDGAAEDHSVKAERYSYVSKAKDVAPNSYSVDYASFGGDFYTYIYKSNRIIASEVNELLAVDAGAVNNLKVIDQALETVVRAENGIYQATAANIEATDSVTDSIMTMEAGFAKTAGLLIMSIGILITAIGLLALASAFSRPRPQPVAAAPVPAPVPETIPAEEILPDDPVPAEAEEKPEEN